VRRPNHEAFVVTGEGENAFWPKVSGVWPHDDGKGFNVELTAYQSADGSSFENGKTSPYQSCLLNR
jgi:hypothetical protein